MVTAVIAVGENAVVTDIVLWSTMYFLRPLRSSQLTLEAHLGPS